MRLNRLVFIIALVALFATATARHAAAAAPIANDDGYSAKAGKALVVDAPGVLANDSFEILISRENLRQLSVMFVSMPGKINLRIDHDTIRARQEAGAHQRRKAAT